MTSTTRFELACVFLLGLAGCSTVQYRPVPLPLPEHPVLTPLGPAALQCLTAPTYAIVVERERAYKNWGLKLEAVIMANNQQAKEK